MLSGEEAAEWQLLGAGAATAGWAPSSSPTVAPASADEMIAIAPTVLATRDLGCLDLTVPVDPIPTGSASGRDPRRAEGHIG